MKRYFPSIKRYSWIVLVCLALATAAGYFVSKSQATVFQVSATMLVDLGTPNSSLGAANTSGVSNIDQANNYSTEIVTQKVLQSSYCSTIMAKVTEQRFTVDDLLGNVVAALPSTTTSTISITASATKAADAVLEANAVAHCFENYIKGRLQDQLTTVQKNLNDQLTPLLTKSHDLEVQIQKLPITDPSVDLLKTDRGEVLKNIETLQSQIQQLPLSVNSNVSVTQDATLVAASSTSKTTTIIAITVGVGLLIGIILMLLMIYLDARLGSEEQVREKLEMAYLGGLSSNKEVKASPTRVTGKIMHELADICANLRLTEVVPGTWHAPTGAVVLITSPKTAEGKTTLAVACAGVIARSGANVVVIDGNLQKPTTHLAFGMNPAGPGLSGLLKSPNGDVDAVVQRSNVPGVWVLPGRASADESAFLLEQKLPAILAQLRKKTDVIIIDGPALLSGADAAVFARMADGVALVVDVRHERLTTLQRCRAILDSLTTTPVGVVMNRLPSGRRNRYYASAKPVDAGGEKLVPVQASGVYGNGNGNGNGLKTDGATLLSAPPIYAALPPAPPPPSPNGLSRPQGLASGLRGNMPAEPMMPPMNPPTMPQPNPPTPPTVSRLLDKKP